MSRPKDTVLSVTGLASPCSELLLFPFLTQVWTASHPGPMPRREDASAVLFRIIKMVHSDLSAFGFLAVTRVGPI